MMVVLAAPPATRRTPLAEPAFPVVADAPAAWTDADVARRSVTALADAVRKAMAEEKAADVLVRGPTRLFEMLKPKFDERGIACRHVEAETIDILVEINETVLTTRLSVWAQSLAEVME